MVVGVWRQSFERAPRYRRGRRSVWGGAVHPGFYRSAGMSDRKPRGAGNGAIRLPSGWNVSSSHLKAVRTGFVRVVSKVFFSKFHSRFVLSL